MFNACYLLFISWPLRKSLGHPWRPNHQSLLSAHVFCCFLGHYQVHACLFMNVVLPSFFLFLSIVKRCHGARLIVVLHLYHFLSTVKRLPWCLIDRCIVFRTYSFVTWSGQWMPIIILYVEFHFNCKDSLFVSTLSVHNYIQFTLFKK